MTDDFLARLMEDLDNEWSEETRSIQFMLASAGSLAIPHLLQIIECGSARQRLNATQILKELKDTETLPLLLDVLKDAPQNPVILVPLLDIWLELVESGTVQARGFRALRSLREHSNNQVRHLVLDALGFFSCQPALDVVQQMTEDADEEIREKAMRILLASRPPLQHEELPLEALAS